ncbi:helix-turn-helix domain-containing protein [Hyphomicrobium sp.]|uniref:helix-turn-helix transcriptional regulator n=1 Tax=Hyphomicrobium sp. TaxID=82 RepID=UPI002E2F73EC|nr:helix-turn-helix domain-containing protein [Hyphomicrobium sp.]HEX2842171.1 helix-turn-helix domain-containing protein [Hyphomicrobium sp.]
MGKGGDEDQVYLSVEEIAEMLRRTPKAIEKMRHEGRGPPYRRLGGPGVGNVVYCLADVQAWLRARHRG